MKKFRTWDQINCYNNHQKGTSHLIKKNKLSPSEAAAAAITNNEDRSSLIFIAWIAKQANSLVVLIFAISSILFQQANQKQTMCVDR